MADSSTAELGKGKRITGDDRTSLADELRELNAQTPATWAALRAVGEALTDDVRVVVVRGAGRSFSAGLDRSLFSAEPGTEGALADVALKPAEQAEERIR